MAVAGEAELVGPHVESHCSGDLTVERKNKIELRLLVVVEVKRRLVVVISGQVESRVL